MPQWAWGFSVLAAVFGHLAAALALYSACPLDHGVTVCHGLRACCHLALWELLACCEAQAPARAVRGCCNPMVQIPYHACVIDACWTYLAVVVSQPDGLHLAYGCALAADQDDGAETG